jgi:hypothetical protein
MTGMGGREPGDHAFGVGVPCPAYVIKRDVHAVTQYFLTAIAFPTEV